MLLPPSNGPRESRRKWAKMDFARYARECAAGGPLATWGDGPGCVGSGGSDPKQRGSDFAFWGSHFTRGPTVCRHPTQPTHPTRRSEKREAPFLVRRRVGCVGWVVQISLVGAAARTFAVITDLGDRRGLRRELSVTIEDTILRRAHGARRTPPASPYVGGGAQLARLRAELLRSCCGGIAAARASAHCHLNRRRRISDASFLTSVRS